MPRIQVGNKRNGKNKWLTKRKLVGIMQFCSVIN